MKPLTEASVHSSAPAVIEEVESGIDAFDALCRLTDLPFPVLLDSSLQHEKLGRFSCVTADPFWFRYLGKINGRDLLDIEDYRRRFRCQTLDDLPCFQGGMINLCAYDLNRVFEDIPPTINEFHLPQLFVGMYDTVVVFDHETGKASIISQGFPEIEPDRRARRAEARAAFFRDRLRAGPLNPGGSGPGARFKTADPGRLELNSLMAKPVPEISGRIFSNFSRNEYLNAVQRCVQYVVDGDIFQVNLSQRLLVRQSEPALEIYRKLREFNPATFAAYVDLGSFQLLSSSPERLLKITPEGQVETRPIKGTRERSCYPEANLHAAECLVGSEKDRAENVMIVDLLRNDLSRICLDESVQVSTLCGIEEYEFVLHLVSVIAGQLREREDFAGILRAIFPGGSITGAPKIRAMEIIAELEKVARGFYCGSLGYFGFNGAVDQNILIRSMTAGRGWVQIPVGGGIVAQSDPVSEYGETLAKAHGMLRAVV